MEIMYTVIYLDVELGYKKADFINQQSLMAYAKKITGQGILVVAIVDLHKQSFIYKCDDYNVHHIFVETCIVFSGIDYLSPDSSNIMVN